MITVRLRGRLGNQMFQYAFGRKLALLHNTSLRIEVLKFIRWGKTKSRHSEEHRSLLARMLPTHDYQLDIFNIHTKPHFTFLKKRVFFHQLLFKFTHTTYLKDTGTLGGYNAQVVQMASPKSILWGYWQSPFYFSGIEALIREEFTFRIPLLQSSISIWEYMQSTTHSVCLHVRRGDYLIYEAIYNTVSSSPEYFLSAAHLMAKKLGCKPCFFIFSDDISWCKQHIKLPFEVLFVDDVHAGEKDGNHLQLMKSCRHFIISNSTFSWWAAWLSECEDKVVIAPKKWFNVPGNTDLPSLIPPSWIRL